MRTIFLTIIIVLLLCPMWYGNSMGREQEIECIFDGNELDPDFNWLEASFGFTMQYVHETVTMVGNRTILTYSPSPEDVRVTIDIPKFVEYLTTEYDDLFLPGGISKIEWAVEQLGFETFDIPLTETPLGTYDVLSVTLFSMPPVDMSIAIIIEGQINAELSGNGVSESLTWKEWGAQEANLMLDESTDIIAEFEYDVNFELRPSITILGYEIPDLPMLYSQDVGSLPFDNSVTSSIYVYSPPDTQEDTVLFPMLILLIGLGVGVAIGAIAGYSIGKKKRPEQSLIKGEDIG